MMAGAWAGLLLIVSVACAAEKIAVGVGSSANEEAKVAGEEAAHMARDLLGGKDAKIVIVFSARRQLCPELVGGIALVFDKNIIYGCEGYSPLTLAGNFADQGHDIKNGVAVMALGGDVRVTAVSDRVIKSDDRRKSFSECGKRIGEQLKAAVDVDAHGRIIVTFGNQHAGDNAPFVEGLTGVAGNGVPVVGAAAGGDGAKEIVKGEIVTGVNVAVVLTGAFNVGVGLAGGGGDLVKKTEESMSAALKAAGGTPVIGMVFDCGGRRGELVKQQKIAEEYEVMQRLAGVTPIFGFYGGGEIGTASCGTAAKGVGFSVATAVLSIDARANVVVSGSEDTIRLPPAGAGSPTLLQRPNKVIECCNVDI